jgi:hypothetical protein
MIGTADFLAAGTEQPLPQLPRLAVFWGDADTRATSGCREHRRPPQARRGVEATMTPDASGRPALRRAREP